jgi:hypothetical protein
VTTSSSGASRNFRRRLSFARETLNSASSGSTHAGAFLLFLDVGASAEVGLGGETEEPEAAKGSLEGDPPNAESWLSSEESLSSFESMWVCSAGGFNPLSKKKNFSRVSSGSQVVVKEATIH